MVRNTDYIRKTKIFFQITDTFAIVQKLKLQIAQGGKRNYRKPRFTITTKQAQRNGTDRYLNTIQFLPGGKYIHFSTLMEVIPRLCSHYFLSLLSTKGII